MRRNFIPIVPDITIGALMLKKALTNPYPNEHAIRYKTPKKGLQYRRQNNKFGQGIHAIWMYAKHMPAQLQALRLDAKRFSKTHARRIAKHFAESFGKPKKIEYATGASKNPPSDRKYRVQHSIYNKTRQLQNENDAYDYLEKIYRNGYLTLTKHDVKKFAERFGVSESKLKKLHSSVARFVDSASDNPKKNPTPADEGIHAAQREASLYKLANRYKNRKLSIKTARSYMHSDFAKAISRGVVTKKEIRDILREVYRR